MSEYRGSVPGDTPRDRAVRIAGCLAELGQTEIVLIAGDRQSLSARTTDLPGLLCQALDSGDTRLEVPGLAATFSFTVAAAEWRTSNTRTAQSLESAFNGA